MGKDKPEIRRNAYKTLEISLVRVIEVEAKINVPEKVFNVLREAGKLHLIEEWALAGIESRLEVCSIAELIEDA